MISRYRMKKTVDEDNPYWMSFSDIMSGLLIIFILASIVLIIQLLERQQQFDQTIEEISEAEQVRRSILEEARDELQMAGIEVQISENFTVLRIPNHLLGFDTAQYQIESQYEQIAGTIGKVLHQVITKDNRFEYLDTVFVEGHTDNRPFIGMLGTGNWGLSAFRAISLWQYWEQNLPQERKLSTLINADESALFSVSGYGEMRPVTENQDTDEELRANRRIDIRFTIRRPTSVDYEARRELLERGVL